MFIFSDIFSTNKGKFLKQLYNMILRDNQVFTEKFS